MHMTCHSSALLFGLTSLGIICAQPASHTMLIKSVFHEEVSLSVDELANELKSAASGLQGVTSASVDIKQTVGILYPAAISEARLAIALMSGCEQLGGTHCQTVDTSGQPLGHSLGDPNASPAGKTAGSSGFNTGAIIGGVVGAVVMIGVVVSILVIWKKKRKASQKDVVVGRIPFSVRSGRDTILARCGIVRLGLRRVVHRPKCLRKGN